MQMQELNAIEVEEVSGGSLASDLGAALGALFVGGAATQQSINNSGNYMLSAMQCGA